MCQICIYVRCGDQQNQNSACFHSMFLTASSFATAATTTTTSAATTFAHSFHPSTMPHIRPANWGYIRLMRS